MQTNLVDQANQPLNQQNPQQITQPVAPLYYTPNAQPYPNVQVQPYDAQPVNNGAQDLFAYNQSLKKRLCCPIVWTWVVAFFYIFMSILSIVGSRNTQSNISFGAFISIIIYLVVATLVNQSSNTGDANKYKLALKIFTVYFIIIMILVAISLGSLFIAYDELEKKLGEVVNISIIAIFIEIAIESTTLCILCKYKNVFVELPIQVNQIYQQSIPPQQL